MYKKLCQFGSAFCASIGMVALAVALLSLGSQVAADEPLTALTCNGCSNTPPCSNAKCTDNGTAVCPNGWTCPQCKCQGTTTCACAY